MSLKMTPNFGSRSGAVSQPKTTPGCFAMYFVSGNFKAPAKRPTRTFRNVIYDSDVNIVEIPSKGSNMNLDLITIELLEETLKAWKSYRKPPSELLDLAKMHLELTAK